MKGRVRLDGIIRKVWANIPISAEIARHRETGGSGRKREQDQAAVRAPTRGRNKCKQEPGSRCSRSTFRFEVWDLKNYNPAMSITLLANFGPARRALFGAVEVPVEQPQLLANGGPVMWILLLAGAVAAAVFVERWLYYHRAQINSTEFLNGVRNVLKRDNIVEAVSICEATPGPIARLVKIAILNRERGRDGVREALEEAGLLEVPRLEERLNLLATVTQIAPLLGLLGTVLGFIRIFGVMQEKGAFATAGMMAGGMWQALVCTAAGLALAIPCYAGYNYLVNRVNSIVLDMEKSATDILNLVTGEPET